MTPMPYSGVWCWGGNTHHQAYANNRHPSRFAQRYLDRNAAKSKLAVGDNSACVSNVDPNQRAIANHHIRCWGDNRFGQANPNETNRDEITHTNDATLINALRNVGGIAVGSRHGCLHAGGLVRCWGDGRTGRLGKGFNPIWVPTPPL